MQQNAKHVSNEFLPDELLIFIGHSDDASAEAEAIKLLESKIEKEFQLLLKPVRDRSPFRRSRVWEWREDALPLTGGQDAVVREALDHARIAIFVFKERVGNVTWLELEQVRERSRQQRLHILAFFPEENPRHGNFPNHQAKRQAARDWDTLLDRQEELTKDWNDPKGVAVTPCPTYYGIDDLTAAVLEKLKMAMADILAVESSVPRQNPLSQLFPSDVELHDSNLLPNVNIPKVFIAYSWDDDVHKKWVAELATRLRGNGVETRIDQWHAVPGDQLPEFMEREIRNNDYVLIICTPNYRRKCDRRDGGAGYEGDIMTAEVYTTKNHRKFIPVLAQGSWDEAAPSWAKGKFYIDLSTSEWYENGYSRLLATLRNEYPAPPPVRQQVPEIVLPKIPISPPVTVSGEHPQKSLYNKHEENAEYIRIPGGSYLYSVTGKEERVPDLYMAKYPVTNKLYRRFIAFLEKNRQDHGSLLSAFSIRDQLKTIAKRESWWMPFANDLHAVNNDLATLFRSKLDNDQKFNSDDQPVVGVSWYAGRAYCLWLSLLEGNITLYRLPTEIEWEWAAGGIRSGEVQKVREWPWPEDEGELSPRLANYDKEIGATTTVRNYPDGATPDGLYDMAGNVWEWMENLYGEGAYDPDCRALRGGSWGNDPDLLRCSARVSVHPVNRYFTYGGFRVVRSSHSS